MEPAQEESELLNGHEGRLITIDGDGGGSGTIRVRPLSMDDLLRPEIVRDLKDVAVCIFSSIEKLQSLIPDDADGIEAKATELIELLSPVLGPLRRCIAPCIDRPLSEVPHWAVPQVLVEFYRANFSGPRLTSWAGLLRSAGAAAKTRRTKSPGTSGTSSSSSSSTATSTGGVTPAGSSNTGSGGASAGTCG